MASTFVRDIRACLRFYSRLPVPLGDDGHAMPDFARVSWAAPFAGGVIGAIGAGVVLIGVFLHLPSLVVAACAVGALTLATGGLHEDGLADLADGFGGGATREQKLAIMRDSRLGAYGALALCLSLLLRVVAVAATLDRSALLAAFAIVSASALSRAVGLIPMIALLPARIDGAGASAPTPSSSAMRRALLIGSIIALAPWLFGATLAQTVVAQIAAMTATLAVTKLAQRQIGGYTGDVLGASQQAAEIALVVAISAA
ncbi:adenosylcobinamide-GDP ribazoletransferase [Methylocystis sp. MJC1]|uniref:adenosylcobinamide-GDP ribazoletransferase n=1 Tax=Methylocystis sp. MJC1 TaxID=2654282 RepID=UPI0013EA9B27|nr:adenosylcobinamide-GDP ribazoletransferase [Methylocystis sp. MJC1]MBU6526671.1 adenosylcobinamide-GDP ribazoletransferase [Methylocystis sp. MJC1]UZX13692.1 adenosylcobinamide-GDP ribazoletransferase [Methylocystis sp. MJC1]